MSLSSTRSPSFQANFIPLVTGLKSRKVFESPVIPNIVRKTLHQLPLLPVSWSKSSLKLLGEQLSRDKYERLDL